ncbi:MAG: hypothetical protein H0V51_22535 [Chloroflexi bacterium]|nr:hypothetical protein [Chloroflexota bacterium]
MSDELGTTPGRQPLQAETGQTREQFPKRAGPAGALLAGGGVRAGLPTRPGAARYGCNVHGQVSSEVSIRYWGVGPERVAWDNRIKYFESRYPDVGVKGQLL